LPTDPARPSFDRELAQRSRYREFEARRKSRALGRFLDQDEIARRNAFDASDLLRMIPGFRVHGTGIDAVVTSSRGASSIGEAACEPNVVIDGMPNQEINLVHPSSIGAMEIYRAGESGPPQYQSRCGLIVIWTRR
jgi:hypothetical protein